MVMNKLLSGIFAPLLLIVLVGCDDYSHNAIPNTPPINFITLTMMQGYGEEGYDWGAALARSPDNGYLIAGSTTSRGYGDNTAYLVRTSSTGEMVWFKWFGGWGDDNGHAVALSPDGNIVVAGVSESFELLTGQKIDPNSGKPIDDYNFYLVKIDLDGAILWEKPYGDSLYAEYGRALAVLPDGYLIAGYQAKTEVEGDFYAVRTDLGGDVVWQRAYERPGVNYAYSVVATSDDGFVLTGYTMEPDAIGGDPYLMKIDGSGNPGWECLAADSTALQILYSAVEAANGDIIAVGRSIPKESPSPLNGVLYVMRASSSGQVLWEKTYSESGIREGRGIVEDAQGALMICGQHATGNDIRMAKLAGDGTFMWSDSTHARGYGMAMIPTETGYAIAGSTDYPDHQVLNNALLITVIEDKTNIEQ